MSNSLTSYASIGWWGDSLNSRITDTQLQAVMNHIKSVGYSGITFDYGINVAADGTILNTSPSDRMLTEIDYARSIGLSVATKVHWTLDGVGSNLNTFNTPATFNANTFLAGVDAYFKAFSPIAQAHGVGLQYLGSESDNFMTAQYLGQWTQIVKDIRAGYSGDITYDGNFLGRTSDPFNQIAIWGLVDKIGLSFYPELSQTPVTNLAQLISLFKNANPAIANPLNQLWNTPYPSIINELQSLSAQYGKKIVLGEVNYQPIGDNLHGYIGTDALVAANTVINNNSATLAYQALYNIIENNLNGIVTGTTIQGYDPWESANQNFTSWIPYSELSATSIEQALSSIFAQQNTGAVLTSTIAYAGDTYTGGLGINTVTYSGSSTTFTLKPNGSNFTVSDLANAKGADTLTNIQRLQFSDTNIALDIASNQTAGSVYMLYQATFNRTPDAGGLGYWIAQVDKGANIITSVGASFVASPEFVAKYGSNPTNVSYIDNLYQNVLHRAGDSGGITYWNQQLNSGAATKAFVLEQFATLAEGAALVAPTIAHGITYTQWVG